MPSRIGAGELVAWLRFFLFGFWRRRRDQEAWEEAALGYQARTSPVT